MPPALDGSPHAVERVARARHAGRIQGRGPGIRQAAAEVPIYERMLPAVPVTVGRIRRELDDALACLDVDPRRREDIALVVTEAATNAVLHAYVDTRPGPLYVTAVASGRSLLVTVCDWGRGMLPHPDSPGAGFGVSLMRMLTDAVEIRLSHADRGTRVALRFHHAIPAIGAPAVSHDVQGAMTADDDVHALRVYLSALAETTAAICDDTQALHAEARHAVARARRLCAQPLNAS